MLFDIAMEVNLVSNLPGCSALQRLSIYADDVVLFIRPTASDLTNRSTNTVNLGGSVWPAGEEHT